MPCRPGFVRDGGDPVSRSGVIIDLTIMIRASRVNISERLESGALFRARRSRVDENENARAKF